MRNGKERRRHPRAPLALPISVNSNGSIVEGKTANISAGGLALLLFEEAPLVKDRFSVSIKIPDRSWISVVCEKVWAGNIVADTNVYFAMGVCFIQISDEDRETLSSIVDDYLLA